MTLPALIFWLMALYALFSRRALFVYLPWLWLPFGAMAVIDPGLTFGSTVQPVSVALAIFILRVALQPGCAAKMWRSASDFRRFGFLSLFTIYAVFSAYILPRVFAGRVMVIPLRSTLLDRAAPLGPTTANFTQAAYTTLSFLVALALFALLTGKGAERWRRTFIQAVFAGAAVLIVTGLIDVAGAKSALEIFRNGSYAIQGYTTVGNVGRITGAYSEASSFGTSCVFLFALCFCFIPLLRMDLLRRFIGPAIAFLLLALAAGSTSSTAYAGIAAFIGFIILNASLGIFGRWARNMPYTLAALSALTLVFCLTLIFDPAIFTTPLQLMTDSVFQKSRTLSYVQRNYWTQLGYEAFWQTWGIGAGTGAVRVSSWPAAIASNLGLVGLLAMGAQLVSTLARPARRDHRDLVATLTAARASLWCSLIMGYFAATVVDPGLGIATAFGLACASQAAPQRTKVESSNWHAAERTAAVPVARS